jgi:hypothetical protein
MSLFDEAPKAAPAASIVPAHVRAAALADMGPAPGQPADTSAASIAQAPAVSIDYAGEARDLIEFAGTLFIPIYPTLGTIYTPEARSRIAAAAAPLMQKYGMTLTVLGPELAFLITIVPFIVPTMKAIKHDRKAQKQNAPQATPAAIDGGTPEAGTAGGASDAASPLARFPGQTDAAE